MAERSRTGSAADSSRVQSSKKQPSGKQSGESDATKAAPKKPSSRKAPSDTTESEVSASSRTQPSRTQALGERLTAATDEHKANADPASATAAKRAATSSGRRSPRRARLRLTRLDPWSVMKTAFLLSIAIGVVTIVSVMIIWSVLGAAGVWNSINATVADVVGTEATSDFDVENYIGLSRVLGFTMLVSAIDVVLLTAIATLLAFLYNMAAALLGGIEVTLVEDQH